LILSAAVEFLSPDICGVFNEGMFHRDAAPEATKTPLPGDPKEKT